ncbi:hypothetical protein ABLT31_28355 [Ammoniphilus sp. 3BR4]
MMPFSSLLIMFVAEVTEINSGGVAATATPPVDAKLSRMIN